MEELKLIKKRLDRIMGKKFNQVLDKEIIKSRNKWNRAINQIINPKELPEITLRIIKIDDKNNPYWLSAITSYTDDLSKLVETIDFTDTFKEKIEHMVFIFIYDNKNEPCHLNEFKSYIVLDDSDFLIRLLKKDYKNINNILEKKIETSNNIEAVKLDYLVFKVKDSKPYTPLKYKGEIITDKLYGWYFTKNFLKIVYKKSSEVVRSNPKPVKNENILDYDFYKNIRKLKKSSRTAIANLESENRYTQYMHVSRLIEQNFISIVKEAITRNEKKLIFLVGNSGDGKSELLRILKNKRPDIYDKCKIHNDATESFYVNKDSLYTLYEILKPFKDENLDNNNECLIVAINMGIIGRLIDTADINGFSELKQNIINSSILKDNTYKNKNYSGWFDYLSFAEYSNFNLLEEAFDVSFIDEMFNKVFSDNPNNFFKIAFEKLPMSIKNTCPVAMNYQLIGNSVVKENIIQLLLYVHLIGRVMITPRIIWNFIYHLLMGTEVERMYNEGSPLVLEEDFYIENIFYNKWYTKGSDNNIFEEIKTNGHIFESEDTKNNFLNKVILKKSNKVELSLLINKIIGEENSYLKKVTLNNIMNIDATSFIGIKTLIRHEKFVNYSIKNMGNLALVNEFAALLYDYNHNKISSLRLRNLEKNLIKIIKSWNGKHYKENSVYEENDFANFRKSVKFEEDNIQIEFKKQDFDNKFYYNQVLFEYRKNNVKSVLEIDFKLFSIIKKIENGYRLNLYERLDSIKLQEFINSIIKNQKNKYNQAIDHEEESFIIKAKNGYYEFKRG